MHEAAEMLQKHFHNCPKGHMLFPYVKDVALEPLIDYISQMRLCVFFLPDGKKGFLGYGYHQLCFLKESCLSEGFVASDFRGGFGRIALKYLKHLAKKKGISIIITGTLASYNRAMDNLYQKNAAGTQKMYFIVADEGGING